MCSLVLSTFLFACESWILIAELEKKTKTFDMKCYQRLLNITYKNHVTNEDICRNIQAAIGKYVELLTLVKERKLSWFGHVLRSFGLAKTILLGTVQGKRRKSRQKKRWEDKIKEWTGMDFASSTRAAENRSRWKGIVVQSSVVRQRPRKVMKYTRLDKTMYSNASNPGSTRLGHFRPWDLYLNRLGKQRLGNVRYQVSSI